MITDLLIDVATSFLAFILNVLPDWFSDGWSYAKEQVTHLLGTTGAFLPWLNILDYLLAVRVGLFITIGFLGLEVGMIVWKWVDWLIRRVADLIP